MKYLSVCIFTIVLYSCHTADDSISYLLTDGGRKYWKIYYYNHHNELISNGIGLCFYKNGDCISYYYDRVLKNKRIRDDSPMQPEPKWSLKGDSILIFGTVSYNRIISKDDTSIKLSSNIEGKMGRIFFLKIEKDQKTEISAPILEPKQLQCDTCIEVKEID